MSTIWKDPEGRERLHRWYKRFQEKIQVPVQSQMVQTRFGPNHVLIAGPESGPPLVVLHAMRTGASFLLSELGAVLNHFRVYAPDLPGQSVRGIDNRLPLKDDSHGRWFAEILDGLGLRKVNLFGVSWGGFVASLAATTMPDRIERLGLMVPAGIANGSHISGLIHMAWPMLRYRLRPNEANLKKLLDPILTTWDEDWAGFIGCSISDMKMDPRIPPLAKSESLRGLTMPVLVLAGDKDISFPGEAIKRRLATTVPHADVEIIANCKHCPPCTPAFRIWLGDRLTGFMSNSA